MAVRFLRKNRVSREKKAHQFPGAAFAFPLRCAHFCTVPLLRNSEQQFSIANSHQVLPLLEVAFETHALGSLKKHPSKASDKLP
jgi:hypothetical protein